MHVIARWAALLLTLSLPALGEQVFSIPQPAPGRWSVDTTGRLSRATLAEVDRLGEEVRREGHGQLAVVMVSTTSGRDPRTFATELFNRWGIGNAERDDGALLFIALDDRAAEIVLGDGVDGPGELLMSEEVMQERIVPAFKRGAPDAAVLAGAMGLRTLLSSSAQGMPFGSTLSALLSKYAFWFLASGVGALGLALAGLRRWLRKRPRICEDCEKPRVLLNEYVDDGHLDEGQQMEESLGSVDYDVWWCGGCKEARVERYGAWFTSYSRCRQCHYKTSRSQSETLVAATYEHGGTVRVTVNCAHCGHCDSFTRHTARLTRSSSSDSGSSSGGGFGGGGSSGSGSSGRW